MVKAVEIECMECNTQGGCKGHEIEYPVAKREFLIYGGSHQADNFRSVLRQAQLHRVLKTITSTSKK